MIHKINTRLKELNLEFSSIVIENDILKKKLKEKDSIIQLQGETIALQKQENQQLQNRLNLYRENLKASHNAFEEYKSNIITIYI